MGPDLADMAAGQGDAIDSRYHPSAPVRRQLNKVFPTHWSFLLGEIALYSFIVLLITGVYLTLFFDPSMAEVTYNGVYQPLRGVDMSRPTSRHWTSASRSAAACSCARSITGRR
jgi:ubiquinol-cytochrome c reductase cytochrome b subunit